MIGSAFAGGMCGGGSVSTTTTLPVAASFQRAKVCEWIGYAARTRFHALSAVQLSAATAYPPPIIREQENEKRRIAEYIITPRLGPLLQRLMDNMRRVATLSR